MTSWVWGRGAAAGGGPGNAAPRPAVGAVRVAGVGSSPPTVPGRRPGRGSGGRAEREG